MAEGSKQSGRIALIALGCTLLGMLCGSTLYAFTAGDEVGTFRTNQRHNTDRIANLEVEVKGLAATVRDEIRRNFDDLNGTVKGLDGSINELQRDLANLQGRMHPVRLTMPGETP